jgi:hypothetical protein
LAVLPGAQLSLWSPWGKTRTIWMFSTEKVSGGLRLWSERSCFGRFGKLTAGRLSMACRPEVGGRHVLGSWFLVHSSWFIVLGS